MSTITALLQPVTPDTVRQAGMALVIGPARTLYPISAVPDTSDLEEGFYYLGVMSEPPELEFGPEVEIVDAGALGLPAGALIRRIRGRVSGSVLGFDLGNFARVCGTTVTTTVSGATTTTSAITVNTTTNTHQVTLTSASGFTAGKTIIFNASDGSFNIARVRSVSTNTIVLDRLLKSTPASGAAVALLTSATALLGTQELRRISIAGIIQFPKAEGQVTGDVALLRVPEAIVSEPITLSFGAGTDAVSIPFAFEGLAQSNASGQVYTGDLTHWPGTTA